MRDKLSPVPPRKRRRRTVTRTIRSGILGVALCVSVVSHDTPAVQEPVTSEPPPLCAVPQVAVTGRSPVEIHTERNEILALVREHRRWESEARHRALAETIWIEATAAEVDPLMVASIIARESSFRTRVVSHAGAVGLMQLRPFVAEDVARTVEVEWRGIETLHDPELNVRLGIRYYKQLIERFDGDPHAALTAYNYGPTRVSQDLRSGAYRGSRYAERVIELYQELDHRRSTAAATTVARAGSV